MKIYTIVMFCIGAACMIPALLLYKGQTGFLYSFDRAAPKDKGEYAKYLGKCIAVFGLILIGDGLVSLFAGEVLSGILLGIGIIAFFVLVVKNAKKYYK